MAFVAIVSPHLATKGWLIAVIPASGDSFGDNEDRFGSENDRAIGGGSLVARPMACDG